MSTTNPLLEPWSTPFETPPFEAIAPGHYAAAFEAGFARHSAEIDAIAGNAEPPTFANTIDALELSGYDLDRAASVFFNLTGANTTDALQALEREMSPRFAEHYTRMTTNARLFARIDSLFERRHELGLTSEQMRVLDLTHYNFVKAGAKLKGAQRERFMAIAKRRAELATAFGQNVLADEKAFALELKGADDTAGLPDFVLAATAGAAAERGMPGSNVVTLSRSSIEPFLTFSPRRDLREQAWRAWVARGDGTANDNRAIITEMVALRQEYARLMGVRTYAETSLERTMAKTPQRVAELLERVWPAARAKALEERDRLQAMARSQGANITIEPWDWRFYAEKVRAADYALDEAQIKPYLPLPSIIEAAFYTATRLFGVTFRERTDVPLYHPDVRAWEVTDQAGRHVGLFYGDYFSRPAKRSGAWMSSYRGQEKLRGDIRPIIVNVNNFNKGAVGEPALLSADDARTLFHEFGHALHGLLSDVTYPSLAGTSVVRDFVELPSQLFEHWMMTPEILTRFARHYRTGAPMPAELVEKLRAARTFNQGFETVAFLGSALVDMAFHTIDDDRPIDPIAFERVILDRIGMPPEVGMRHRATHFQHIFSGGYSAGYYSYLWSEVLDADAFAAFEEAGDVFDPAVAARLKTFIYAAGGSSVEDEAYVKFRGRLPSVDGLLRQRGLGT